MEEEWLVRSTYMVGIIDTVSCKPPGDNWRQREGEGEGDRQTDRQTDRTERGGKWEADMKAKVCSKVSM